MPKYYDYETKQEVAPEEAQALFEQGRLAVDAGAGPAFVTDSQGQRYSTEDPTQLSDMLSKGFVLETGDQTAQRGAIMEARNSPGLAAGEALARGATLGLSDVAAGAVLGEDYSQRANLRRQELGPTSSALEIAGGIAPALATGGSSLGARALASTPAGLLARGTGALGASLERSMLARGATQGTARLAGMLAEGGVDGALSGVGAALSESSLGNTEVTAENLLASGGLGALFGAGAGGLFGAATSGASRGARGLADSLRKRTTGETVERGAREAGGFRYVPDAVIDQMVTKGSPALGIDPDVLRRGFDDPAQRADLINSQAVKEEINRKLRTDAQEMLDNAIHVRRMYAGEIKANNLRSDVKVGAQKGEQALQEAQEILGRYEGRLEELRNSGVLKKGDVKRLESDLNLTWQSARKNLGALSDESGEAWRGYEALENLKRSADQMRKKLGGTATGSVSERMGVPALREEVSILGDDLRKLLEREDLFGAAGTKQASRNAALSKALQTGQEFRQRLVRGTGESVEPEYWEVEKAILDGDKVDNFVNNLLNPNRDYTNDQIKRHLTDMADMYETVLQNGDVPEELTAQFEKARDGARRMLNTLGEAEERLGRIGQFEAAAKAEEELSTITGNAGAVGAMMGGFAAGPVGALAGGALGKVVSMGSRPTAMLKTVARMEAIAQRSRGAVDDVRSRAQGAVRRLAKPRSERRVSPIAAKAVSRAAIQSNERDSQRKRARNVERKLSELQRNPLAIADALAYQTKGMAEVAPATSLALAQQVSRAVEFLRGKLPPAVSTSNMLQPGLNERLWDAPTVDKFARYLDTISDPKHALSELEKGQLSPESVEALKAVYPNLYNEMRVAVAEELATHGEEMPFDSVVQLSLLMDIDGHPSMTPAYQAVLAESRQKHDEQAKKQTPSPSRMKPMSVPKSLTERLSGGLE